MNYHNRSLRSFIYDDSYHGNILFKIHAELIYLFTGRSTDNFYLTKLLNVISILVTPSTFTNTSTLRKILGFVVLLLNTRWR